MLFDLVEYDAYAAAYPLVDVANEHIILFFLIAYLNFIFLIIS